MRQWPYTSYSPRLSEYFLSAWVKICTWMEGPGVWNLQGQNQGMAWSNTVVGQSLSHVQLFVAPWTAAHQFPLSSTISWSLLRFMPIVSVMLSNHIILCHPFLLCLWSCPASDSFLMTGSSHQVTKVLELQHQSFQWIFRVDFLQDWLAWSPWNSRDSQESSPEQFKSIDSSVLSLLYGPTLTSVLDYWKNIAFTIRTFVSKVAFLLFNTLSRFVNFTLQGN